jgi:very-short-patch-repair endonuclease
MRRVDPNHVEFSRTLRTSATDAERKLWHHLRANQLNGARFRRQHPVGIYVLDFACVQQRLAVELDGGQHADDVVRDATKTAFLETQGWRVLRFWNNDVMGNIEGVLTLIAEALLASSRPPPHPSPCQGEGAKNMSPCQGEGAKTPSPSQGEGWDGGAL